MFCFDKLQISDSLYMALSGNSLEEVIKPELREEWDSIKHLWFPRTDNEENKAYDKRTPGKAEYISHCYNEYVKFIISIVIIKCSS